ncbi:MAG: TetR/AcrR family transcriptional regulator [Myxococcaceae bacterium]
MARPRQITDEQILASMREAVLAHGPAVSLDVVAGELNVSGPALLKRFGSRQALMLAALKPSPNPEWIAHVLKGPTDAPLEEQLLDIFTRLMDFMSANVPCLVALRESGIPMGEVFPKAEGGPERGIKVMQRWLRQAKKQGLVTADEVDTAAFAVIGALQTRAFFTHLTQKNSPGSAQRQYVAELARLFARTLAPASVP